MVKTIPLNSSISIVFVSVTAADLGMFASLQNFCRAKKDVKMPQYHFVDHRIEILSHDDNYDHVKVYEGATARKSSL